MKILAIIKKEYSQIVRKKSFLISTLLTPLLMAVMIFLPLQLTRMGRETKTIEIMDFSGRIGDKLLAQSQEREATDEIRLKFILVPPDEKQNELIQRYHEPLGNESARSIFNPDAMLAGEIPGLTADESPKSSDHHPTVGQSPPPGNNLSLTPRYLKRILSKESDGLLLIPADIFSVRSIYFFALNISDFTLNQYMTTAVQKIVSKTLLAEHGYDVEVVEKAIRDVNLGTFKVKKEGVTRSTSGLDYLMSIFMLTILFMVIMAYGQIIMRGIIEEKNSRIIEVLISSTRPRTLFYGKIIGVGLAGMTQIFLWILLAVLFLSQFHLPISSSLTGFLSLELAVYFIVFFTIGYFMYSIFFSIVGASVNTDQEAQQFAGPIFTVMFIPFLLGIMVTQNPNTLLVTIASLFPLFSPTLMFMRISVAVPPPGQILISIVFSVLTIWFLAWLGAKIFQTGILMYGKRPTIREIIRWARYR